MTTVPSQLLNDALDLPTSERARLAALLIQSLEERDDAGAEQAWSDEIRRRLSEVDAGTAQMIPWNEARSRIRGENGSASD